MLKGNYLFAVFSHLQPSYQLLYLFTENGPMPKRSWLELKTEMVDLKFKNLNGLNEFVAKMAERIGASKSYVFSPREFNYVLENIEKGDEFLETLIQKARLLEANHSSKKSTFWDNF